MRNLPRHKKTENVGRVDVEIQLRKKKKKKRATLAGARISETDSKQVRQILEHLLQEWPGSSGQKSRFDFPRVSRHSK